MSVQIIDDNAKWIDTGTVDSLTDATIFIRDMQNATKTKIGCIEEIAFQNGWLSAEQLKENIQKMGNSEYRNYIQQLLK